MAIWINDDLRRRTVYKPRRSGYKTISIRRSTVKQPNSTLKLHLPAELFNDCVRAIKEMIGEQEAKMFLQGSVGTMTKEQQIEFFCKHVRLMEMFEEIDPDVQVGVVSKRPRAINSIKHPCPQALALHKLARKM